MFDNHQENKPGSIDPDSINGLDYCVRKNEGKIMWFWQTAYADTGKAARLTYLGQVSTKYDFINYNC